MPSTPVFRTCDVTFKTRIYPGTFAHSQRSSRELIVDGGECVRLRFSSEGEKSHFAAQPISRVAEEGFVGLERTFRIASIPQEKNAGEGRVTQQEFTVDLRGLRYPVSCIQVFSLWGRRI